MKALPHLHHQIHLEDVFGKKISSASRKHQREALQEKHANLRAEAYALYTKPIHPAMLDPNHKSCLFSGWQLEKEIKGDLGEYFHP